MRGPRLTPGIKRVIFYAMSPHGSILEHKCMLERRWPNSAGVPNTSPGHPYGSVSGEHTFPVGRT